MGLWRGAGSNPWRCLHNRRRDQCPPCKAVKQQAQHALHLQKTLQGVAHPQHLRRATATAMADSGGAATLAAAATSVSNGTAAAPAVRRAPSLKWQPDGLRPGPWANSTRIVASVGSPVALAARPLSTSAPSAALAAPAASLPTMPVKRAAYSGPTIDSRPPTAAASPLAAAGQPRAALAQAPAAATAGPIAAWAPAFPASLAYAGGLPLAPKKKEDRIPGKAYRYCPTGGGATAEQMWANPGAVLELEGIWQADKAVWRCLHNKRRHTCQTCSAFYSRKRSPLRTSVEHWQLQAATQQQAALQGQLEARPRDEASVTNSNALASPAQQSPTGTGTGTGTGTSWKPIWATRPRPAAPQPQAQAQAQAAGSVAAVSGALHTLQPQPNVYPSSMTSGRGRGRGGRGWPRRAGRGRPRANYMYAPVGGSNAPSPDAVLGAPLGMEGIVPPMAPPPQKRVASAHSGGRGGGGAGQDAAGRAPLWTRTRKKSKTPATPRGPRIRIIRKTNIRGAVAGHTCAPRCFLESRRVCACV